MAFENKVRLSGSDRTKHPNSTLVGPVPPNEQVRVTLFLRHRSEPPIDLARGAANPGISRSEFAERYGADPRDIAIIEAFAHEYGITVVESSAAKRRIVLMGTAQQMSKAFNVELQQYRLETTDKVFRGRSGWVSVPQECSHCVTAVLGLDTRPIARPHFRKLALSPPAGAFTPTQVSALYNFPAGVTGSQQTIALIELGGGYSTADLGTYFANLGVPAPSVVAVSVDGGQNSPGSDADAEVMLDIEVAGAVAPGANIVVYFAPNTDQGFIDAITDAAHDATHKPSIISISWGGPEDSWIQQSQSAMNSALQDAATLGVTVTIAAGDSGSSDGVGDGKLHVDFPASSPYALACGGTLLRASGNQISSEVVWNETANNEGATGGGVSNVFPLPAYQNAAGVPKQPQTQFAGRGVPDIAGDADPSSGYYITVDGQNQVVGGTSAVAPLWAGLIALLNEHLGTPAGFINPKLYAMPEATFHDIVTGNNDDSNLGYYSAKAGWDPCTGLGSPDGAAILEALGAGSASAERVRLPGSTERHSATERFTPVEKVNEEISATIVLRHETTSDLGQELLAGRAPRLTRQQAVEATSANPADIAEIAAFANRYGLKIVREDIAARSIRVDGTVQQMENAFGIRMGWVEDANGHRHLSYQGAISLPKSIAGMVVAVLGLDKRPAARSRAGTA
jgi:kumamolisin